MHGRAAQGCLKPAVGEPVVRMRLELDEHAAILVLPLAARFQSACYLRVQYCMQLG